MSKQDEVEMAAEKAWLRRVNSLVTVVGKIVFMDGFNAGLAHQSQWRRVEDELPADAGWYLVTAIEPFEDIRTTTSFFINGYWNQKVIAWMPLPEPSHKPQ